MGWVHVHIPKSRKLQGRCPSAGGHRSPEWPCLAGETSDGCLDPPRSTPPRPSPPAGRASAETRPARLFRSGELKRCAPSSAKFSKAVHRPLNHPPRNCRGLRRSPPGANAPGNCRRYPDTPTWRPRVRCLKGATPPTLDDSHSLDPPIYHRFTPHSGAIYFAGGRIYI